MGIRPSWIATTRRHQPTGMELLSTTSSTGTAARRPTLCIWTSLTSLCSSQFCRRAEWLRGVLFALWVSAYSGNAPACHQRSIIGKGGGMRPRQILVLLVTCFVGVTCAAGDNKSSPLTEQHRIELIRTVNADDRALITQFVLKNDRIHLEINGGPVKKTKWYQHVTVGVGGAGGTPGGPPGDPINNPRGSYVDLVFEHHIPDLTVEQVKQMLWPVFDFDSKSAVDAYLKSVQPNVKEAIKNHQVLVGMNREMVIYAKGRPEKKIREKDGETEYEDWIYGDPPHDVDFVRVVADKVIRVETMKVGGEKVVRTEREVDLEGPTVATAAQKESRPVKTPTLRRPGEEAPNAPTSGPSRPTPIPDIPAPPPQFET